MDLTQNYLKKHLITYLGNKRSLLKGINNAIIQIKKKLNTDLLSTFDGFSGSGVVARLLKYHSHTVYANDLEKYSCKINEAYLSNPSEDETKLINEWIDILNNMEHNVKDIISTYYSPKDDTNIQKGERTFYTNQNAMIIDTIRQEIDNAPKHIQKYLLAQLLIKASIHVNTSGVFKGFYKNKQGIGQFGGEGKNALTRITGKIILEQLIYSEQEHKVDVTVFNQDINKIIKDTENLPEVDVTYYDPPYNQHPYSSNYFMLNLILENKIDKTKLSKVSGIISGWNKSDYNYKKSAKDSFHDLLKNTRSKFIVMSYNNEGILHGQDWLDVLDGYKYEKIEVDYNAFKGSRNLKDRNTKVKEILWIIDNRKNTNQISEEVEKIIEEIIEEPEQIEEQLIDYNKIKVSELKKEWKNRGMRGYYKYKKAGLILKLQENDLEKNI